MAAYAHGFVVSIIGPTGQPLRESDEVGDRTIRLPYESEYKIRLKNKNRVRCKAQVLIDGMDISPGRMFILKPDETLDLERFLADGDLDKGNRFKFVNAEKGALTGEIQDPTSMKLGYVEVKFHKEYIFPMTTAWTYSTYQGGGAGGGYYSGHPYINGVVGGSLSANNFNLNTTGASGCAINGGAGGTAGGAGAASMTGPTFNCVNTAFHNSVDHSVIGSNISPPEQEPIAKDAGGTAMGSDSNQKFLNSSEWFYTESPISLWIRLKGPKQAIASQPVADAQNFVILDKDGNMLGLVKTANIKLNAEKNFVEIDLVRQVPGTDKEFAESSVVAEFYQDDHRYQKGRKVTVVRLATGVTDLKNLAWGKSS